MSGSRGFGFPPIPSCMTFDLLLVEGLGISKARTGPPFAGFCPSAPNKAPNPSCPIIAGHQGPAIWITYLMSRPSLYATFEASPSATSTRAPPPPPSPAGRPSIAPPFFSSPRIHWAPFLSLPLLCRRCFRDSKSRPSPACAFAAIHCFFLSAKTHALFSTNYCCTLLLVI